MNTDLVHLSFYRFYPIKNILELRAHLRSYCAELKLMGTILLAPEGVNAGLSGTREAIHQFKTHVQEKMGILHTAFKEAEIDCHAYKRMLVKLKKEIITLGVPEVRPHEVTGKRLDPAELKLWLDQGRSVVLLDTRNDYEVEVGTFTGAKKLDLKNFREFGVQAPGLAEQFKDQAVVTFCTGGIRCEKASALLLQLGLKEVYQLEGGILRYFEENGSAHFDGNCFVFDWRLAVDDKLKAVVRSADPDDEFGRHRLSENN